MQDVVVNQVIDDPAHNDIHGSSKAIAEKLKAEQPAERRVEKVDKRP